MEVAIESDVRARFGTARDQGERPTCLVFAASDVHASLRQPWVPLSCEYLFFHAQRRAKRSMHDAATVGGVHDALQLDGQPREERWPYSLVAPRSAVDWKPPSDVGPLLKCVGTRGRAAVDALVAKLRSGEPCVVLLQICEAFFEATPKAPIRLRVPNPSTVSARHAVVAVALAKVNGDECVLVRNSWGEGWCDRGHAWVSATYLEQRVFGLGTFKETTDVSGDPATS